MWANFGSRSIILCEQIGKIETVGAEKIRDISRLTKELEESQERPSPEGASTLPNPYHPQDKVAAEEQRHPQQANDEGVDPTIAEAKKMG